MRYIIRGDENFTLALCESDETKSILQNVYLILTTRKGSIPMYREFGIDRDFIGKPITVARTLMISRVKNALEDFEPRAEFIGLTFEYNSNAPCDLIPILEVEIYE